MSTENPVDHCPYCEETTQLWAKSESENSRYRMAIRDAFHILLNQMPVGNTYTVQDRKVPENTINK